MKSPSRWETLRKEILANGVIESKDAEKLRELLYEDGEIGCEQADFLFALNDVTSESTHHHRAWTDLFVEALTDFVLSDEGAAGVVDADKAIYLIEKIGADGVVDTHEIKLLVNVTQKAAGTSPEAFSEYVLAMLKQRIVSAGAVDAEHVGFLRMVMYGEGGLEGFSISREEAATLFSINNETSGAEGHHASWQAFFVEAIESCVLDDELSFGEVDSEEAAWLVSQINTDGLLDSNEMALLRSLHAKAPLRHPTLLQYHALLNEG